MLGARWMVSGSCGVTKEQGGTCPCSRRRRILENSRRHADRSGREYARCIFQRTHQTPWLLVFLALFPLLLPINSSGNSPGFLIAVQIMLDIICPRSIAPCGRYSILYLPTPNSQYDGEKFHNKLYACLIDTAYIVCYHSFCHYR